MSEDFYALLGVAPAASDAEIERVYRRLARAYHPDLLRDVSSEERRSAETRLKAINRAHHTLGDRERRAAYEQGRQRVGAGERPVTASPVRPAAPNAASSARRGVPRPVVARTTHQAGGGPIDIAWGIAPPVVARPVPDLFTVGRLLRYALLIVLFALLLGLLWRPSVVSVPVSAPTPGVPTAVR